MKKELDEALINKYPLLYSRGGYYGKGFTHFECNCGWFNLLDELSASLEELIKKQLKEADQDVCDCGCYKENHIDGKCNNKFFDRQGLSKECGCDSFQVILARPVQIKEKFGSLRAYFDNTTKEMNALISEAENKSYTICEECGQEGKIRKGGWIRCLCDEHSKGRETIDIKQHVKEI